MTLRIGIAVALLIALAAGTAADRPVQTQPVYAGGYRVLSGDFHLHSALGSGGALTPWGLVNEAQRQGLDVVALTGHNETWDASVAHAFSRLTSGPLVLVGEEITSKTQDLVAVGVHSTISPALSLRDQIAEVHRQGGVAIAAHPILKFHDAYRSSGAMAMLDGTEVCHPLIYTLADGAEQLAEFSARTAATPIGSSDFHLSGRVGVCRTFLFVDDATERGVLEAIRSHRTVVYGLNGRVFGEPTLVQLADGAGLRDVVARSTHPSAGLFDWISRLGAAAGLLGIAVATRRRASRPAAAHREFRRLERARYP